MKVLFLYPKFPENTFWGFKHAISFIGKKAVFPPLGLLTVAALLPEEWEKKVIDLNIEKFSEADLKWPDFIFVSAMVIQRDSVWEIINLAKKFNKKIVAGGPLFTTDHDEFSENIDHFVLGEAETSLPVFLDDFKNGVVKKFYKTEKWPDIKKTPAPLWDLVDIKKYASMGIQYSRGCPFNCEFCDIVFLNGRIPRTKDKEQILRELEIMYIKGWRGDVFFVDDNFIGNKVKLKEEILPAIIKWMEEKKYPFSFTTQVSVNIADDKDLMDLMSKAGFKSVFVGIESPKEESLKECGKFHNTNRNLLLSVKAIQNHGIEVSGGFIIGFDKDTPLIFNQMYLFVQKSGIASAMVGLLQAASKTRLWERLKKEKRLTIQSAGSNTDCTINFIPKMNLNSLISGYKKLIGKLYSPKNYYQRMNIFLREYKPRTGSGIKFDFNYFLALLKSVWFLGILGRERYYYWAILFTTLLKNPKLLPLAIGMAVKGYHLRKISEKI